MSFCPVPEPSILPHFRASGAEVYDVSRDFSRWPTSWPRRPLRIHRTEKIGERSRKPSLFWEFSSCDPKGWSRTISSEQRRSSCDDMEIYRRRRSRGRWGLRSFPGQFLMNRLWIFLAAESIGRIPMLVYRLLVYKFPSLRFVDVFIPSDGDSIFLVSLVSDNFDGLSIWCRMHVDGSSTSNLRIEYFTIHTIFNKEIYEKYKVNF